MTDNEKRRPRWPLSQRAEDLSKGTNQPSAEFSAQLAASARVKAWGDEWKAKQKAQKS